MPNKPKSTNLTMPMFAVISSASYSKTPLKVLKDFKLNNQFQLIRQYTNKDMLTVKHKHSGKVIIGIRGTDKDNETNNRVRDLLDDIRLGLGKNDKVKRVSEVEPIIKRAVRRYGKNNIILTGHSLGAYVSTRISKDLGLRAVVFNIGSSPMDENTGENELVTNYTTNDPLRGVIDPLSITSSIRDNYKTIKVKQKKGVNVHSIENFTPDI